MRSRLFKLNGWIAGSTLLAALLAGCGDKFSAGNTTTTAGAGGSDIASGGNSGVSGTSIGGSDDAGTSAGGTSTGGSGNAGTSGGVSTGGGSGGVSAAGAGGKAASTCSNCAAGTYCQEGTNKCRSCADFSRIEFAAPEKLATLSPTKTGNERFPRAASTGAGTDLFYRSGAFGSERIYYAANPATQPGTSISPMLRDSGPMLAAGVLEQNFFFDRLQLTTNVRSIMTATWVAGQLTGETPAPPPINGAASDFSIAIAPGAARAYWMSSRNGKSTGAELVWAGMVGGSTTEPAVVDLQFQAEMATCPWLGGDAKTWDDDATPWVNSAGTILLFRAHSVDSTCKSNDAGAFDLYAAPLSKDTGLPTAPGIPLAALNDSDISSTETDPSLSADSCTIYYASDSGAGNDNLYRAARN